MDAHPNTRFENDTSVLRIKDGIYQANMNTGWWIMRGPNGGYIAAVLQNALDVHLNDPTRRPRSLTIHYLSPPSEGEAEIHIQVERSGRSLTSLSIRLMQGSRLHAIGLAAISKDREGFDFDHMTMPEVPSVENLSIQPAMTALHERYDQLYIDNQEAGQDPDAVSVAAWIRLKEPQALTSPVLAAYSDALRPSLFTMTQKKHDIEAVPIPTIDLTLHYRTNPSHLNLNPEDFCLAVCRSRLSQDGHVEEDGEIWSPCGSLLLQSRQLSVTLVGPN
ncbi:MAG: hypothetical protein CL917_15290 [Deltaproteobacteria bacterium]|nr:hypothetical protein [Deltaproteobacteria bacterium]